MSFFGFGKKKAVEPITASLKYGFVAVEAEAQIADPGFRKESAFVRAYGRALVDVVAAHVEAIMLGPKKAPSVSEKWQNASKAHIRDLAALLAWLHAKAAFQDVDEIYKPAARKAGYETLMTLSGNFFGTGERAMALCHKYDACERGDYVNLGGGTLDEGGTYFIHPDSAFVTTHLWMINESLDGSSLNVKEPPLDPSIVFYLQNYVCNIMNSLTEDFLGQARETFGKLR